MLTLPIAEKGKAPSCPIHVTTASAFAGWSKKQPPAARRWLESTQFNAGPGRWITLPGKDGDIKQVVAITDETPNLWSLAHLPAVLPAQHYHLEGTFSKELATQLTLGWALAGYQFTRYKKSTKSFAVLRAHPACDFGFVQSAAQAIGWARDLINTPANDLTPAALAEAAVEWAQTKKARVRVVKGEDLLKANYPTIYAVGKAAAAEPHLVDIRFARKGAPKLTLVGKGVTFDSGGLDIKSSANMKMMKKDMGGAACVLALARLVIEQDLPVELRLLLPLVENAVSGNATRPLDIVKTRKGLTVEIGNTDAEGRLILCDALSEADDNSPDLLIDCATLTGAARVALGTDIPAFFTHDDRLAEALYRHSQQQHDPLWRLPLWKPYRAMLDTPNADISNDPDSAYGGAITAALYLNEFVSKTPSWLHIDMMAWNLRAQPGRPAGGEAMAVRALYALIRERYGKRK